MSKRIHMVSLGCPKNKVDSEAMIGLLAEDGHDLTEAPEDADVIVINTCGFIDSAKEESIDTILEMAEFTRDSERKLVVAGCLVQRYHEEVAAGIPEIDVLLGSADFASINQAIAGTVTTGAVATATTARKSLPVIKVSENPKAIVDHNTPRVVVGPTHSVYLKIAEGCDRPCGFCIIPKLRGSQRSRSIASIVDEANQLVAKGALEINLIAQDLTRYGYELPDKPTLAMLLAELQKSTDAKWIRLHYTYPTAFPDELIGTIAASDKVVPYIDVPLQHIDDDVLKIMRRGHTSRITRDLLQRLRNTIEDVVIRTTFIVGHPGETEDAFSRLLEFIREQELDHVGAFPYSPEPGTHSATLAQDVAPEVAQERLDTLMAMQRGISREKLTAMVGRELDVLVDGPSAESDLVMSGRYAGQAPGVDGVVYLQSGDFVPGTIARVRVDDSSDYDLVASAIEC